MKTYKLFFGFVMIGVITAVISFQTIHFIEECDSEHYCHIADDHQGDSDISYSPEEEVCSLCDLKLHLISPVDFDKESESVLLECCALYFNYEEPAANQRPDAIYLRGPPRNS